MLCLRSRARGDRLWHDVIMSSNIHLSCEGSLALSSILQDEDSAGNGVFVSELDASRRKCGQQDALADKPGVGLGDMANRYGTHWGVCLPR